MYGALTVTISGEVTEGKYTLKYGLGMCHQSTRSKLRVVESLETHSGASLVFIHFLFFGIYYRISQIFF